jgi:hypothetical protein
MIPPATEEAPFQVDTENKDPSNRIYTYQCMYKEWKLKEEIDPQYKFRFKNAMINLQARDLWVVCDRLHCLLPIITIYFGFINPKTLGDLLNYVREQFPNGGFNNWSACHSPGMLDYVLREGDYLITSVLLSKMEPQIRALYTKLRAIEVEFDIKASTYLNLYPIAFPKYKTIIKSIWLLRRDLRWVFDVEGYLSASYYPVGHKWYDYKEIGMERNLLNFFDVNSIKVNTDFIPPKNELFLLLTQKVTLHDEAVINLPKTNFTDGPSISKKVTPKGMIALDSTDMTPEEVEKIVEKKKLEDKLLAEKHFKEKKDEEEDKND